MRLFKWYDGSSKKRNIQPLIGEFLFNEIMIIFMAVMITDILILDLEQFNSWGLPTSTTVSIVFDLIYLKYLMAVILL